LTITQNGWAGSIDRSTPRHPIILGGGVGMAQRPHTMALQTPVIPIGRQVVLGLIRTYFKQVETLPDGLEVAFCWEHAPTVAAHPEFLRPYHLAPSALVAGATALAAGAPRSKDARRTLATAAAAYVAGSLTAAAHAARSEPKFVLPAAASFSALHAGYGVGMLQGVAQLAASAIGNGAPPVAVGER
jgi:hypothetical protein